MTNGSGLVNFIKKKWYLMLVIVVGCSLIGALKGASVESKRQAGITEHDLEIRERIDAGEDIDAPVFIGQIALASEQNEFLSYKTALLGAGIGIVFGIALLMLYYKISETMIYNKFSSALKPKDGEEKLFIDF